MPHGWPYIASMANTKPKQFTSNFTMRVDDDFLRDVDDLRVAHTRPIVSRADYLRHLVAEAKRKLEGKRK